MLQSLFKKTSIQKNQESPQLNSLKNNTWYQDRYENVQTQRNILLVIGVIFSIGILASTIVVGYISTSKTLLPFVVQIEENTGYAKIVNPTNSNLLSANDALGKYFIKKYISARETYNPVDFDYNQRQLIRVLSTPGVYREYFSYIRRPDNDPRALYGQKNTTYIRFKSISKLNETYFIRFAIYETTGTQSVFDRVATVTFQYIAMELRDEERDINPVGFQITGYKVEDDKG